MPKPELTKEIITQLRSDGVSYREIGERYGITESAVRRKLHSNAGGNVSERQRTTSGSFTKAGLGEYTKADIEKMIRDGEGNEQIAEKLGCHYATVTDVIKRIGLDHVRAEMFQAAETALADKIRELAGNALGIAGIARELKIPTSRISRVADKHGIKIVKANAAVGSQAPKKNTDAEDRAFNAACARRAQRGYVPSAASGYGRWV